MKVWIQLDLTELQSRWGKLPPEEHELYNSALVEFSYMRLLAGDVARAELLDQGWPGPSDPNFVKAERGNWRKVWAFLDLDKLRESLNVAEPSVSAGEPQSLRDYWRFLSELGLFRFLDHDVQMLHTAAMCRSHLRLPQVQALIEGRTLQGWPVDSWLSIPNPAGTHPPAAPVSAEIEAPRYPPAEEAPELVEA